MYIKYRLDNGTFVKVMAPGWMPGPINTDTQGQELGRWHDLIHEAYYAYSKGVPFEGHNVTMIEEKL
jgi:hypothetical protein